nr:MAG TPA: hypothetical protein [Microviridae sp.]
MSAYGLDMLTNRSYSACTISLPVSPRLIDKGYKARTTVRYR